MSRLASFYAPSASTLSMDPSAICSIFDGMVAFPSLEELYIDDSMPYASVIWGKDCFNNDTVSSFSKLEHLTVSRCDKLEIVIPHAMLPRLSNLKLIQVYHCSNLRTMFPPSVASDLRHLTELSVGDCREMREIIEEGEQVITDGILFPELTYIYLRNMPCLTSVWCYQSGKASTCKVPLQLPQLSSISLYYLPQLRRLFHGANFEFHVPALKEVRVDTCEFSTLFTFSMFRKFQLEHLEVRNCQLLENIVEDVRADETCDNIIRLSQLTAVMFHNLPNLKSFFHTAVYEFHMPVIKEVIVLNCGLFNTLFTRSVFKNLKQLEELSVCDCELLESIFEDARADETPDTSDKIISLNRVSTVRLQRLPKLKSIFYGETYECYMPALENVNIVGCGLSVLFTCSVFQEIQQLEELHVSDCVSLEHIVKEVGGDEISEINGNSITSFELSLIHLENLPNLRSFSCTLSYVFNMPELGEFRFIDCPQIEYFSSLKTNTPLVKVQRGRFHKEYIEDLNDYITQNHKTGSHLSDCAGESSYSSQGLGTQSEIEEFSLEPIEITQEQTQD